MKRKILSVYPNCSLGGMTTVLRNRAVANPEEEHHLLFHTDLSGMSAYAGIPNISVRIVARGRLEGFLRYIISVASFDEIRIISLPEVLNSLNLATASRVNYEFHTSDEAIIDRELGLLDRARINQISVPSIFLQEVVRAKLPASERDLVVEVPNLIDGVIFNTSTPEANLPGMVGGFPLIWIGRFDKGKNPRDFLRVISLLQPDYHGILIVSFETQPERISEILADAAQYGLSERISILLNLSQVEIAGIYRFAALGGGVFCSTSLGESYGYGVAEALASGLPTVAYDVGALAERTLAGTPYELVPVGGVHEFADRVRGLTEVKTSLLDA